MIDRCPALIARGATTDDVVLALRFGRDHDLPISIRGGGGTFGIVTSFEFRLHPVTTVLAGFVVYPLTRAREVFRVYRECVATAISCSRRRASRPPSPLSRIFVEHLGGAVARVAPRGHGVRASRGTVRPHRAA